MSDTLHSERREPQLQFLVLETTRRCNLRCIHCAVSEENNLGNYPWEDMPIEVFQKLLPLLRTYKPMVQLSGHGETFLHPNFMEMLEEVARAGCPVSFQTNGTLLNPRNIERIVRAGVHSLVISIDAASPELFDKIRRLARFDKIIENIRLINETKKRLGTDKPQLGFEFSAMRQNIHELPAVVALAGDLGVANLQVTELIELNLTRGQSLVYDPAMTDWAAKAEAEAQKRGINLILPPNIPGRQVAGASNETRLVDPSSPATYKGLRKTCREPWEKIFVYFDGTVRPCCMIPERYGDLSVQSFEDVWSGPKHQALRAALLSDEPFDVCVRCPFYGWEPIESEQVATAPTGADPEALLCQDREKREQAGRHEHNLALHPLLCQDREKREQEHAQVLAAHAESLREREQPIAALDARLQEEVTVRDRQLAELERQNAARRMELEWLYRWMPLNRLARRFLYGHNLRGRLLRALGLDR